MTVHSPRIKNPEYFTWIYISQFGEPSGRITRLSQPTFKAWWLSTCWWRGYWTVLAHQDQCPVAAWSTQTLFQQDLSFNSSINIELTANKNMFNNNVLTISTPKVNNIGAENVKHFSSNLFYIGAIGDQM